MPSRPDLLEPPGGDRSLRLPEMGTQSGSCVRMGYLEGVKAHEDGTRAPLVAEDGEVRRPSGEGSHPNAHPVLVQQAFQAEQLGPRATASHERMGFRVQRHGVQLRKDEPDSLDPGELLFR